MEYSAAPTLRLFNPYGRQAQLVRAGLHGLLLAGIVLTGQLVAGGLCFAVIALLYLGAGLIGPQDGTSSYFWRLLADGVICWAIFLVLLYR